MKRTVTIDHGVSLAVEVPEAEGARAAKGLPERVMRAAAPSPESEMVTLKLPTVEITDPETGEVRRHFISFDQSHSGTYQWICDQFGYGELHTLRHGRFPRVHQMVQVESPAEGTIRPVDPSEIDRAALARRVTEVICFRK